MTAAGRAAEAGVAVRERPAVCGGEGVAVALEGAGDADDRRRQVGGARGAVERAPGAEPEHATVSGDHAVPVPAPGGGDPDDGRVEVRGPHRSEERGVAEVE